MMNLNLIAKVLIICLGLLEAVSSTPTEYTASDGQKYLIEFDLKFNWLQALHKCASEGYQLIVIDSKEKNTVIIDLLKKAANGRSVDLWTGGNDEFSAKVNRNRPFFWSATGERLNFTYWLGRNPNNDKGREHCAQIWSQSTLYQWNDCNCEKKLGFICEVTHFKKTFNKDLKHKCDVVKNITSSISDEINQAQKQQFSAIDSKNQQLERVGNDLRAQIKQQQINTQMIIQKKLDAQNKTVQQLIDEMQHQVKELTLQLERSKADASARFGTKLSDKLDEIKKIC